MPAFIIEKTCSGCGNCARVCPHQAITVIAGVAKVNPDKCDDCELCLEQCITGSITFVLKAS